MAMLLNQCTLFIGLLFFSPWESICFTLSHTSLEMPLQSCILTMTSRNFQHILSWELNSSATIPTHYTVSYTVISADEEWKTVESCTNIIKSSCNMTDIYEINETYFTNVTGFNGKEKLVECMDSFFPITDTILDPPEVSILGFKDAINVTVHHPASLSKIRNEEKELFSSVVIKVQSSNTLSKDLTVEMDDRENVTTIIDSLIPNSNYCVSAHWDLQFSKNVIQSPLQCIMLSTGQESVLGILPEPKNVRMNSVNLKNILHWEPPDFYKGNVTYTAQYKSYRSFEDECKNIILTSCDFSNISKYGNYTLRVRAESEDDQSDWVNITFCPLEDTIIGPPGIQVESLAGSLYLHFSYPNIENEPDMWTLRDYYYSWTYNVQYWKNGTNDKLEKNTRYDSEVLTNLDPWTVYCLQVQGFIMDKKRSGEWSQPVCAQTTDNGSHPYWTYVTVLIVSMIVVLMLVLGCFCMLWYFYRKVKCIFFPGYSFPQHLKEYLEQPSYGISFLLPVPSSESESFDKLSVIEESENTGHDTTAPCDCSAEVLQQSLLSGKKNT
ncbi:interleukin-10 receptor subunit beta-like isoform X3 [Phascolarctos cinereus]